MIIWEAAVEAMKAASGDTDSGGAKNEWLAVDGLSLDMLCDRDWRAGLSLEMLCERTWRDELTLLVGRDSTAEPVMAEAGSLLDVMVKNMWLFLFPLLLAYQLSRKGWLVCSTRSAWKRKKQREVKRRPVSGFLQVVGRRCE